MLLTGWPMKIRGTIKGISPEQAKKMFNYDMPSDAKGVSFCVRNNTTRIFPYYPEKYATYGNKPPEFLLSNEILMNLIKISSQILPTVIRPAWNSAANKKKYSSGHHLFISRNFKRIRTGIENIIFTIGNLPCPQTSIMEITDSYIELRLQNANSEYELGIIVMNSETLQINHSLVECSSELISIPISIISPMVFLYYKKDRDYSPSIRIYPNN